MTGNALLDITGVAMHFGGIKALDRIDLTVAEDEILGIIGPNGAGKTTLFNVITGMLRPTAGSVKFRGHELVRSSPDAICRYGIARTFQKVRPFPRMTVVQNVMVPILNRETPVGGMGAARDIAMDLLERVGIAHLAATEARGINLFHRKKVELARALGAGAKLLLLDEVMAGLTPVESDAAVDLLRTLKSEFRFTIVCIEHVMRIIMSLSDRIVALDHGRVLASGTPAEVAANEAVQIAYLGSAHA
jgi:branched-chain amino acid transport system ATP-binding protein